MIIKHIGRVSGALLAAAFMSTVLVAPASAAPQGDHDDPPDRVGDGVCNVYGSHGELCLYYFSNRNGSLLDLYDSDEDLENDEFLSPGPGHGQSVTNNVESVWNRDRRHSWRLCTEPDGDGDCMVVRPNRVINRLPSNFRNNVESAYLLD